jgi:AraC-like DNA-binding protein
LDVTPSKVIIFRHGQFESEAIRARFGAERFDRHFHDTFSVGLVTGGANVFSYRGRRVEVEAGAICLADPGEVHDGGQAGLPWSYANVFPSADLMRALADEAGLDGVPAFAAGRIDDPDCIERFRRFFRILFGEPADADEIAEAAADALGHLIAHHAEGMRPANAAPADREVARRALETLHDAWNARIGLEDVARAAGTSRFGVIRAVSAATGLTPHAYLIQLRVDRAKVLIRAGAPVVQAALACGFADQAHLTRAMKRRWGATPGAFKARGSKRAA